MRFDHRCFWYIPVRISGDPFQLWFSMMSHIRWKFNFLSSTFFNPSIQLFVNAKTTGVHRTRVAAVTLDNMAEDAVAASASLWQILTVSVRYCGPAFVSWLSMLWDTLTRNSELQWFGISSQFRLELSRGDEGVGLVCFPGDEGVGRPWRGYRCVQMNVGPV